MSPPQARAYFEKAGRLAREQLDPCGEADAVIEAAVATCELGQPALAIEMMLQV